MVLWLCQNECVYEYFLDIWFMGVFDHINWYYIYTQVYKNIYFADKAGFNSKNIERLYWDTHHSSFYEFVKVYNIHH